MLQLKIGDLEPDLQFTLTEAGAAKDLTSATSALVRVKKPDGTVWTREGSVDADPTTGIVRVTLLSGDTDTAGLNACEVVVTWSGGDEQTFPADGYEHFQVVARL